MIFFVVLEHKIPILAHYQFSNLVTWICCHLLNEEMQIRETFPLIFYLYICIFIYLLYVCICVRSCVSVCIQYICRCVCLCVCMYTTACIQIMSGNFQEMVPFYLVGMYLQKWALCVFELRWSCLAPSSPAFLFHLIVCGEDTECFCLFSAI